MDDAANVERWARRQLLQVELVHNLPKTVQRDFLRALRDAYAKGYEAAVAEIAQPLLKGS